MKFLDKFSRKQVIMLIVGSLILAVVVGVIFYSSYRESKREEQKLQEQEQRPKVYKEQRGESFEDATNASREITEEEIENFNEATTPPNSATQNDPTSAPSEDLIKKFDEATSAN